MKIYTPIPIHLVRVTISKLNEETFYINLCETTQERAMEVIKGIIDDEKISVFQDGHRTRIDFRNCIGAKNGKSKAISFRGLSPKDTYNLIVNKLPKNN
jgi:hypothetical protein